MAGELEVERESLEREAIGGIEGRKGFGRGEKWSDGSWER